MRYLLLDGIPTVIKRFEGISTLPEAEGVPECDSSSFLMANLAELQ